MSKSKAARNTEAKVRVLRALRTGEEFLTRNLAKRTGLSVRRVTGVLMWLRNIKCVEVVGEERTRHSTSAIKRWRYTHVPSRYARLVE